MRRVEKAAVIVYGSLSRGPYCIGACFRAVVPIPLISMLHGAEGSGHDQSGVKQGPSCRCSCTGNDQSFPGAVPMLQCRNFFNGTCGAAVQKRVDEKNSLMECIALYSTHCFQAQTTQWALKVQYTGASGYPVYCVVQPMSNLFGVSSAFLKRQKNVA